MASNHSEFDGLPPLPSFTLRPQPPLVPGFADKYSTLIMPIFAYWASSMIFHFIDTYDYFPQYRLHTPAEVFKRNKVSRWEVVRDVIIQQFIQILVGFGLALAEPEPLLGKEDYDVAVWAQRIRLVQRAIPSILAFAGVDAQQLASRVSGTSATAGSVLAGGHYPLLLQKFASGTVPAFAQWEMSVAKLIYWYGVPAFQFALAITILDTWQYFLHRAMHMNKWLYTTFHSRHHRLYVPYAYGALYNHPFEGFLLDTLGAGIGYLVTGMTPRQGMCFFTGSTIKTVDDHCGYAFPWDPLQHITSNNAGYHDVHHQSWGIKSNFSQPFFTFWDRLLGTKWTGGDVSARYERARLAAEQKLLQDTSPVTGSKPAASLASPDPYGKAVGLQARDLPPSIPQGKATEQAASSREQIFTDDSGAGGSGVLADESAEEVMESARVSRRSPKKSSVGGPSLKGLRNRMGSGSFHGRTGGVLGYDLR